MNTDPQQIRADVDAALAGLPADPLEPGSELDLEDVGRRLERAHQILVDALESVEKG